MRACPLEHGDQTARGRDPAFVIHEKNKTVGGTLAGELVSRLRSIHRTTFIRCRSNPTTIGRIIFRNATNCGAIWNGWQISTISGGTFGLKLKLAAARYDAERSLWSVTTRDASDAETTCVANAVVTAVGQLNRLDPGVEVG